MKKILFLLAFCGVIAGCGDKQVSPNSEQPDHTSTQSRQENRADDSANSMAGTKWVGGFRGEPDPRSKGVKHELTFAETDYTLTVTTADGVFEYPGTYVYEQPTIKLFEPFLTHTGSIEENKMQIDIWMTNDIVWELSLEKQ